MAEYTQTYWNELMEKYRNGSISDTERYELEKQALDDPFLFDALEGFALYDKEEEQKQVPVTKIFTLPRIALAASLVLLLAAVFHFTTQNNVETENKDAIAMVLEDEKDGTQAKDETAISQKATKTEDKVEVVQPNQGEQTDKEKNGRAIAAGAKPDQMTEKKEVYSENNAEDDQVVNSAEGEDKGFADNAVDEFAMQASPEEELVTVKIGDLAEVETQPSNTTDADMAKPVKARKVPVEEVGYEGDDESPAVKRKKADGPSLYYEAVPVIGKKIFDDYARERIDKRGLRQTPAQEVTIEFVIDKNGNLSDFRHIFTGCPECGPFAISILQNSGEWKTVPPGFSGKARYTFMF